MPNLEPLDVETMAQIKAVYESAVERNLSIESLGRAFIGGTAAMFKSNGATQNEAIEVAAVVINMVYDDESIVSPSK